jgi:hypothetical protein
MVLQLTGVPEPPYRPVGMQVIVTPSPCRRSPNCFQPPEVVEMPCAAPSSAQASNDPNDNQHHRLLYLIRVSRLDDRLSRSVGTGCLRNAQTFRFDIPPHEAVFLFEASPRSSKSVR